MMYVCTYVCITYWYLLMIFEDDLWDVLQPPSNTNSFLSWIFTLWWWWPKLRPPESHESHCFFRVFNGIELPSKVLEDWMAWIFLNMRFMFPLFPLHLKRVPGCGGWGHFTVRPLMRRCRSHHFSPMPWPPEVGSLGLGWSAYQETILESLKGWIYRDWQDVLVLENQGCCKGVV